MNNIYLSYENGNFICPKISEDQIKESMCDYRTKNVSNSPEYVNNPLDLIAESPDDLLSDDEFLALISY